MFLKVGLIIFRLYRSASFVFSRQTFSKKKTMISRWVMTSFRFLFSNMEHMFATNPTIFCLTTQKVFCPNIHTCHAMSCQYFPCRAMPRFSGPGHAMILRFRAVPGRPCLGPGDGVGNVSPELLNAREGTCVLKRPFRPSALRPAFRPSVCPFARARAGQTSIRKLPIDCHGRLLLAVFSILWQQVHISYINN